jgi:hypothetical protein
VDRIEFDPATGQGRVHYRVSFDGSRFDPRPAADELAVCCSGSLDGDQVEHGSVVLVDLAVSRALDFRVKRDAGRGGLGLRGRNAVGRTAGGAGKYEDQCGGCGCQLGHRVLLEWWDHGDHSRQARGSPK